MKNFISLLLAIALSATAFAQGENTFTIDLNNPISVTENLNKLAKAETAFWMSRLTLSPEMEQRIQENSYSVYMQYVEIMKSYNYTLEKVQLAERYNFNVRRDRFMQTFLNEKDFATYEKIVKTVAEKEMAAYSDNPTKEILAQRIQSAGWNVIGQTIIFK